VSADSTDCGPGGRGSCPATARPPLAAARFAAAAAAALLVGKTHPALAATFFSPFAELGYQHNSNVFMRPSSAPPFAAEGITALGDTIVDYQAGLDSELDWGGDRLTLRGSATRDQYDRFSFLNHYEYLFDGDLHWRLTGIVDGTVTYEQTRYMAPFTDTFSTALLLDTERTASVPVRILMTPEWRLDLTPELHQAMTPLPGFPDFKLDEKSGIAGVEYLGFGRLTAGLQFTDTNGRYEEIAAATRYQQHEFDLTANYKVGGFSTFSASAGYTTRDSEANPADSVPTPAGAAVVAGYGGVLGKTSGVTGALSYQRQLTGKTNVTFSIFRRVDSYAAGANPEVGTGGAVAVAWQADPKFLLKLNYGLTRDEIQGGLVVVNAAGRTDTAQTAAFEVNYLAVSWLTVRPYAEWDKASSTFLLGNYSEWIYGIKVTARLRW
jgi:hypothetical protein